jgi:Cu/Ag efflux pump CusA
MLQKIMASILMPPSLLLWRFFHSFSFPEWKAVFFNPLGISFIVSLFASLVVALTVTPVMCSYLLTSEKQLVHHESGSRWIRWLNHHYGRALTIILNYKKVIIGGSVALLIFALVVMSNLGRTFLPEFNEGMLTLSTVSLPGISLEESNKMNLMIEEEMLAMPEIETITRRTGRAELDEHAQGVFSSEVDVPFTLTDRSKDEFLTYLRARLATIRGINITVGQPLSHRIDHMLSGTRANIAIKVFGTDLQKMFSIASQIRTDIQEIDGLVDVNVEQQVDIPQLQI